MYLYIGSGQKNLVRHSRAGGNPEVWIYSNLEVFLKCRGLDSRLRGNDGGRFGLIRKRTYKGRLKIGIAESTKSFSDDLFFKAESNQPAG